MNFLELAAVVVGSLFFAGIVAGFLIIEMLPGCGRRYKDRGDRQGLPPPRDHDERPPRWPGG